MSVQTPKGYQKKSSYTSPIGLLKNYGNTGSLNSNSYQQQFFKIKAIRLQAQIQQLKQQNSILKSKLAESTNSNQMLRQKIKVLQSGYQRNLTADRSFTHRTVPTFATQLGYPSSHTSGRGSPDSKYYSGSITNQKSYRSNYNSQIQRLLKQNRVLKNQHEVQMTKLRDDNKKLTRKIFQIQSELSKKTNNNDNEVDEKIYRQKQQDRLLKLQKINNELRKENQEFENEKKRIQQKCRNYQQNNKSLRRQNQQLKAISSSKVKYEQVLQDYRAQNEKIKNENKELQRQLQQLKRNHKLQLTSTLSTSAKQQQKQAGSTSLPKQSVGQNSKLQRQIQSLIRKLSIQQQALQQKDEQIKGVLTKLKPLMEKQRNTRKQKDDLSIDPKRASLSLLQVFLKKYKINTF